MATFLIGLSVVAAAVNLVAVGRGWKRVEWVTKPLVMVVLIVFVLTVGRLQGALPWFCLGLAASLAGDVFLLLPARWFIAGLAAFLLAHIGYLVGFNSPPPAFDWFSLLLAVMYALLAGRIYPPIAAGLVRSGRAGLRGPVAVYSLVITLMLLAATMTLFRQDWTVTSGALAFAGAALFYMSDVILAFDRFVQPIRNGRIWNMSAYHLGQILLTIGVVMQFTN